MHKKVSTSLNFTERELEILKFWKDESIFEKSIEKSKGRPVYTFYDGPPTANGKPHIGHILTRVIKDIIPRYRTMKGYNVLRKAGWDTHGLPVELEVEKLLGINGKQDIEKFGVEPFIRQCKQSVWKYEGEWRKMSERVGFWADMDNPYVTYHNTYIESVWWALKQIWDKGLLYKGHKIVPYCPRCGTALSSHEVAQGYKDVKEPSIYVKFKVSDKDNEYFLAWTTTPWTLPSNVALAVNADENYVRVKRGEEVYILAEDLVEGVFGNYKSNNIHNNLNCCSHNETTTATTTTRTNTVATDVTATNNIATNNIATDVTAANNTATNNTATNSAEDNTAKINTTKINTTDTDAKTNTAATNATVTNTNINSTTEKGYDIIERFKGSSLVGVSYVPLFDFAVNSVTQKAWYVVAGDFVTLSDGTGIVHIAPAFGEDDARVGRANNLPFVQMVNEQGKFVDAVGLWKGMFVKDADPLIIKQLESDNKVLKVSEYEHSYPFCWRCDTHLLYYARDTWFIAMTRVKELLLENNQEINWLPENIKDGRFGNFLENVVDWGLSRERYWGTPLPVWECSCGYRHCIGSMEELKALSVDLPEDIELHKPYIDNVHVKCPQCKGSMKRVTEVIDCWFDSGAMPFAQWHYPFENKQEFEDNFPADFISEALDQTRGWFYTLLAISTLLFGKSSYKNCIVLGLVQDKEGQKMSKHKGNVVDPWVVLDRQGADAVRWYFYTNSAPWLPSRFYEEAVSEAQRKFMGTLWNTYAFYVLYANIDGFDATLQKLDKEKLSVMDKWILSKLNTLIEFVDKCLENYKITESARAIQEFADQLSNWYVRRCRERFWQKEMTTDKINAYMTLYTVLVELSKTSAPFIPFMAEEIYRNLVVSLDKNATESIHLCNYSEVDKSMVDKVLEEDMDRSLKLVVMGRACRNTANIKNRQPLSNMYVKASFRLPEMFDDIVKDELNIKNLTFVEDATAFVAYRFKPQLKTLGPRYGKLLPKIGEMLKTVNGGEVMDDFEKGRNLRFEIDGTIVELAQADLLIETSRKEGMITEADRDITVVLDTNLTNQLIDEGFLREIISKLQTMRKEAGFDVQDHIIIRYGGSTKIALLLSDNNGFVADETLADEISSGITEEESLKSEGFYVKEWNINGENACFAVRKSKDGDY